MTATTLAPYASDPARSRGRLHGEAEDPTRSPFQRDRDRIIHSAAFRRLKYKTQVFVYHEGDNYRTRLTHSLEVSQIARTICRYLRLNEDLAEALALAHDLGHTPFGHAGEEALDAALAGHGGFDHNAQALRIVTKLEHRYAAFDGLNLTWETLEGLVKHNGPLTGPQALNGRGNGKALPVAIEEYAAQHDLQLDRFAGPEAQVAAVSDDIAYNNHDIDDGLRANLFALDDMRGVSLVGKAIREVETAYPGLEEMRRVHEVVRRLTSAMVSDLMRETERRVAEAAPDSVEAVRGLDHAIAGFSEEMRKHERELKEFLWDRMYRHYKVNRMTSKAKRVVRELYDLLFREPDCLPSDWQARAANASEAQRARIVGDYIAGMTDRFALEEHQRLYDKYTRV